MEERLNYVIFFNVDVIRHLLFFCRLTWSSKISECYLMCFRQFCWFCNLFLFLFGVKFLLWYHTNQQRKTVSGRQYNVDYKNRDKDYSLAMYIKMKRNAKSRANEKQVLKINKRHLCSGQRRKYKLSVNIQTKEMKRRQCGIRLKRLLGRRRILLRYCSAHSDVESIYLKRLIQDLDTTKHSGYYH